jgi:hypothetical protein
MAGSGQLPQRRPQPGHGARAPLLEADIPERLVLEDDDAAAPDQMVDPALISLRPDALGEDHHWCPCGRWLGRLEDRHRP